jgi:hypothetical protein
MLETGHFQAQGLAAGPGAYLYRPHESDSRAFPSAARLLMKARAPAGPMIDAGCSVIDDRRSAMTALRAWHAGKRYSGRIALSRRSGARPARTD